MNIAISLQPETNTLFGHFGHAPAFQLYEIENNEVTSSKTIYPNGGGHHVMVNFMIENNVEIVICGHLGTHAFVGLQDAGIKMYHADENNVDIIIQEFLNNSLEEITEAQPCNHDHDEHECCGGCHQPQIKYDGKNAGKTVSVHYTGTLNDGTKFDSSYDRNQPLQFVSGVGQMIAGFDKAVVNMEIGEEVDIHLTPEEAYGMPDPQQILTVNYVDLPGSENLELHQRVYLSNQFGQQFPVTVTEKTDTTITLDANHEMAGKELNFHIKLVSIDE